MEPLITTPRNTDYPDWHYQPLRLLTTEIADPMGVISEFFSAYKLPQARKHLKEMLEDAVCNVDAYAINYLTIYNDIEKLVEAAWLLLQAEKEDTQKAVMISRLQDKVLAAILQLLVAAIRPERIFLLSWQENTLVDLLIVVPDTSAKPFSHYETLIETAFCNVPELCFSLIQANTLAQHIEDGHLFYLSACTGEKQVYSSSPLHLPQPAPAKKEEIRTIARQQFGGGMNRAAVFFESAKTWFETNNNGMALFMLHQAAELAFRAIIIVLIGYEVKEHKISVLQKHTRRCAPELNTVFPADTEKEKDLLALLDSAYLKARYTDKFTASVEDVLLLLNRVQTLHSIAQDNFARVMGLLH